MGGILAALLLVSALCVAGAKFFDERDWRRRR